MSFKKWLTEIENKPRDIDSRIPISKLNVSLFSVRGISPEHILKKLTGEYYKSEANDHKECFFLFVFPVQ